MKRLVFAGVVGVPFLVYSTVVVAEVGYLEFWRQALQPGVSLQVLLDLCISASLVIGWMVRDARGRGLSPWPWVALTLPLGSVGPLGYLVVSGLSQVRRRV